MQIKLHSHLHLAGYGVLGLQNFFSSITFSGCWGLANDLAAAKAEFPLWVHSLVDVMDQCPASLSSFYRVSVDVQKFSHYPEDFFWYTWQFISPQWLQAGQVLMQQSGTKSCFRHHAYSLDDVFIICRAIFRPDEVLCSFQIVQLCPFEATVCKQQPSLWGPVIESLLFQQFTYRINTDASHL